MTGVRLTVEGKVARLVLDRPGAGNAIDLEMALALAEAAIACDENHGLGCLLLTGSGRLFCAGGDISGFDSAAAEAGAHLKRLAGALHLAVSRLARMRAPLVVMVNGPAAGAGMSLALLGDIVIAAASAHFTPAYRAIGLTPDGGMTWLLPRLVGLRRAQELILMNRRVSAREAARLGLVTRVVDDAVLEREAEAIVAEIACGPTAALASARALLLESWAAGLETQMEAECRAIAEAVRSSNGREGVAAFLARRQPQFT